jgi:hypothetical protein
VKGPYEFLIHIRKLQQAYGRFRLAVFVLNALIISIVFYALFLLIGLPAFTAFYWQDSVLLSTLPVSISLMLGLFSAALVRRRKKSEFFDVLGPELSEKARTAYDNREVKSVLMESLAEDLKSRLSKIKPSQILDLRQIKYRIAAAVLLAGATIFIAQSQISADITPADFQAISDIRDRALDMLQNEPSGPASQVNLSGNIYGNPSLAILNEAKLELVLYPGLGAGSMSQRSEPLDRLFSQSSPSEAAAVPSELYIESLPPQNKEIIKRYFELLSTSNL